MILPFGVRRLGDDWALAMADLHGRCFDHSWSEGTILDLLNSDALAFGLVVEDTLHSFGLFQHTLDEVEVLTLATHPDQRGRHLAEQILSAVVHDLRPCGAEQMFLEVAVDNPAAMRLYERFGFETVGRRKGYYRRPQGLKVDALVMQRSMAQL